MDLKFAGVNANDVCINWWWCWMNSLNFLCYKTHKVSLCFFFSFIGFSVSIIMSNDAMSRHYYGLGLDFSLVLGFSSWKVNRIYMLSILLLLPHWASHPGRLSLPDLPEKASNATIMQNLTPLAVQLFIQSSSTLASTLSPWGKWLRTMQCGWLRWKCKCGLDFWFSGTNPITLLILLLYWLAHLLPIVFLHYLHISQC
jgi:hypothetical protein